VNTRRLILAAALVAAYAPIAFARQAANFPSKPIKIIVPVAPGGNVDLVARAIADPLSRSLGQPVIVENRPGASSIVGTMLVAKAEPDGYTLLAHSTTFVTAPLVLSNARYDPIKDFAPITVTCQIPMVMVVNTDKMPARTLKEFIALAKAKPGAYAYATAGNGSTGHIAAELFSHAAGVSMMHVPYKGNGQAIIDVIGGVVPLMFDQVSTSSSYIRAGKLHAIGVTSKTRSSMLPNVPTLDESGLPGFEDSTFNGLFAPAGTPPEIVKRLHAEVAKVLKSPELVKLFRDKGIELTPSATPDEFGSYLKSQLARYTKLARDADIKPD
jgi:tripartite-type tricarboxylate transporter receptor subunit TctC